MSPRRRPGSRLFKSLLPTVALVVVGVAALALWSVYTVAHPPTHAYLINPADLVGISARGVKATEETWSNADGTKSRGWLLRGAEGAPAVVLLHGYGADRSWLFNLGVQLNEATNFTVLCPDLRGHGQNPTVSTTTFGAGEAADVAGAISFLRGLRTQQRPLVGERVGLYGVGLGAYAALLAAARESVQGGERGGVVALALDSPPASAGALLRDVMRQRVGVSNAVSLFLARAAAHIYFLGKYENVNSCDAAATLRGRRVLLLSGTGEARDATTELARCFPDQGAVELKTDLPVTGLDASSATGEAGEAYDRIVIDYFQRTLR
ncbi:MAG: alpha/beta fold hydrolase [Acidobacteria bacterium]|nr:alpha/beta fold hydrolase [Acidobacteriota bacterium]